MSADETSAPRMSESARKLLKKLRVVVFAGVVGVAIGLFAGVVLARASFAHDAALSFAVGVLAFGAMHILERAYHYWRVPRNMARWSADHEEMSFETIRAGIHFAECQVALADLIERCPKPYEDVVMLTSQIGYVMHSEAIRHAEEAGIIPKICWDQRRSVMGLPAPSSAVTCERRDDLSRIVEGSGEAVPSIPAPPLLPRAASASNAPPTTRSGGGFTIRSGKLVLVK